MYGVIGEKLPHSFSKEIHEAIGSYKYNLIELKRDELPYFITSKKFDGINVTIPYKETVIPYLDYIEPNAKKINAVNTIVNRGNKLYGYNTDYLGLIDLISYNNISLNNKKVLILGSGGTSNTAYHVSYDLGALDVKKVSRYRRCDYITYDDLDDYLDYEIIINTTPCGMYPNDDLVLDVKKFKNLSAVIDCVYNPIKSKLIRRAESLNIKAIGGLYMLVSQAVHASSIFLEKEVDNSLTTKIYKEILKDKINIVLVGMPSAGKSTISKLLAKALKKQAIETDKVIEKKIDMKISEFFETKNETKFREIEKEVVDEVSFLNGKIISTGGGVVLDYDNIDKLRRNGLIIFINRPLKLLTPSPTRPLATTYDDLEKLYNDRYELYLAASDIVIKNDKRIEKIVQLIVEAVNENFSN